MHAAVVLHLLSLLPNTQPLGPPVRSPAQQLCGELGLWYKYLKGGTSAAPPCLALGIESEPFCTDGDFEEDACAAVAGDHTNATEVVSAALLRAQQLHRTALWDGTCAFTISAWNNAAVVEVFVQSILQHNPALSYLAWFVADDPASKHPLVAHIRERFSTLQRKWPKVALRLLTVDDMQRSMPYNARELAFRYTVVTFNTAIKPHVFKHLFATGARSVIFFDPDCQFYSHLDEVALMLHWRTFVLIPHETWPTPDDGEMQTDLQLMRAGVFNYGFLALSGVRQAMLEHYLSWWADKLRYQGFVNLKRGMHFDQNWAVFIPVFYPQDAYEIILDGRYDAAYWNLHYTGQHITVDHTGRRVHYAGSPMVFYHFSGVATSLSIGDGQISPHQSRYKIADFPQLTALFNAYKAAIHELNASSLHNLPYGYDRFANGVLVPNWVRSAFAWMSRPTRVALTGEAHTAALSPPLPASLAVHLTVQDPFATTGEGTVWAWLFMPNQTLADAACTDAFDVRIVTKLLDQLGLEHPKPGTWPSRWWLSNIGVALIAYLAEADLQNPALRRGVQQSLRPPREGVGSFEDFCAGARADSDWSALCTAVRKQMLLTSSLMATGTRPPHLEVADAFQRLETASVKESPTAIGVNVVGYFHGAFGVAHSARLVYRSLRTHQPEIDPVAVLLYSPSHPSFPSLASDMHFSRTLVHRTTVVIVNADSTNQLLGRRKICSDHYWIGFWVWELEKFPSIWWKAALALDEIWVPSDFVAVSLRNMLSFNILTERIPVFTMPFGMQVPQIRAADAGANRPDTGARSTANSTARHTLHLPHDAIVFLITFDFMSVFERKGPLLAINAFKLAFDPHNFQVHLLVKSINGHMFPRELKVLELAASGWANIHLLNDHLLGEQMRALETSVDCYVSLHRSEGYGLNILGHLLRGVPVIATLYSGNMEFQQHLPPSYTKFFGVGFKRAELDQSYGPYAKGQVWAQPKVREAADAMRRVVRRPRLAHDLAAEAAKLLSSQFNMHATGKRMLDRLREIETNAPKNATHQPAQSEHCHWLRYLRAWRHPRYALLRLRRTERKHGHAEEQPSASCSGFSYSSIARAAELATHA